MPSAEQKEYRITFDLIWMILHLTLNLYNVYYTMVFKL
jgi:hypothetical protein